MKYRAYRQLVAPTLQQFNQPDDARYVDTYRAPRPVVRAAKPRTDLPAPGRERLHPHPAASAPPLPPHHPRKDPPVTLPLRALARPAAALAAALTFALAPLAAPWVPAAHAAIVPNVQDGRVVQHPNRFFPDRPFPGYTDADLERIVPDPKLRIAFEMALSHDAFRTHFAPAFIGLPGARIVRQGADPIVRPAQRVGVDLPPPRPDRGQ